jgi:hypothetical protein
MLIKRKGWRWLLLTCLLGFCGYWLNEKTTNWSWTLLMTAGVASGCLALALLRPQRSGLSPPTVMLSLGIGGMLMGFAWDCLQTSIAMLEALCISTNGRSVVDSLRYHLMLLPGMHVMMIAGGLAAIPTLRMIRPECRKLCALFAQNMLCSGWMLLGMTIGGTLFVQALSVSNGMSLARMVGGMMTGMVWGMVISVAIYRLYFILHDYFRMRKRLIITVSTHSK